MAQMMRVGTGDGHITQNMGNKIFRSTEACSNFSHDKRPDGEKDYYVTSIVPERCHARSMARARYACRVSPEEGKCVRELYNLPVSCYVENMDVINEMALHHPVGNRRCTFKLAQKRDKLTRELNCNGTIIDKTVTLLRDEVRPQ